MTKIKNCPNTWLQLEECWKRKVIQMTRRIKPCANCGSNEIITHESGGVVRIICQTCGREVVHKGERADAERIWDDNTGSN